MLSDIEWNNPHPRPGGESLESWVEGVKWLERNGWLRDPATLRDADACRARMRPARQASERFCHALCWRPRCKRAGRCRHLMPLGLRDWQPEFGLGLAEIWGLPAPYHGPYDAEKLARVKLLIAGSLDEGR